MELSFNGATVPINSIEDLSRILDRFEREPQFELWISTADGPVMGMLRNGDHAWPMHMARNGDSGVVTRGNRQTQGTCAYTLANGQIDEYPLSRCVGIEECFKAIFYFYANDGARYDFVSWQEA